MLMKKFSIYVLLAGTIISINSCKQNINPQFQLLGYHELSFPSASAIEYYNNQLFIFGDDASYILVLNTNYQVKDTIRINADTSYRISKAIKPDIESAAISMQGTKPVLHAFGSMSTPNRNEMFSFPLTSMRTFKKTAISFQESNLNIKELNIEGATFVHDDLLLINRANKNNPVNQLIRLKSHHIADSLVISNLLFIKSLQLPENEGLAGVSGLYYVAEKDLLLFTASEEDTPNAIEDGIIGESYLGWILDFSQKKEITIKADQLIKLSSADKIFNKQKIESVCVQWSRHNSMMLHLVSDNDDGRSKIFKGLFRF